MEIAQNSVCSKMLAFFLLYVFSNTLVLAENTRNSKLENAESLFDDFIVKYNKHYSEYEKTYRFEIFKSKLERINKRNKMSDNTLFGITQFSDLTEKEFLRRHTGLTLDMGEDNQRMFGLETFTHEAQVPEKDPPAVFDWRKKNVVTPVKNQGVCGCSWAFAATAQMEGVYAIKTGILLSLSEQQLVDCADHCNGCCGGSLVDGFRYRDANKVINEVEDYLYVGHQSDCHADYNNSVGIIKNVMAFIVYSSTELQKHLYENGPIAVGVRGSPLQDYNSGILLDKDCDNTTAINHAALLVGYGVDDNGLEYWTLKNSWSRHWGEEGYFRVERGKDKSSCGMLNEPIFGLDLLPIWT